MKIQIDKTISSKKDTDNYINGTESYIMDRDSASRMAGVIFKRQCLGYDDGIVLKMNTNDFRYYSDGRPVNQNDVHITTNMSIDQIRQFDFNSVPYTEEEIDDINSQKALDYIAEQSNHLLSEPKELVFQNSIDEELDSEEYLLFSKWFSKVAVDATVEHAFLTLQFLNLDDYYMFADLPEYNMYVCNTRIETLNFHNILLLFNSYKLRHYGTPKDAFTFSDAPFVKDLP